MYMEQMEDDWVGGCVDGWIATDVNGFITQ